jgi:hypothetical protein
VLIIVAFLAIISGALVTELSTNFLLSRALVNRVANEATVSSAMELSLDQLQHTQLDNGCPVQNPVALNGRTAIVSIPRCFPVVDNRSPFQFTSIASSSSFSIDGTHAQLPGLNDYVVGDAGGTIFDYPFGQATRRWRLNLGGSVTGPILVMPDPQNGGQFLDLIPMSGPNCAPSTYCVSVQSDDGGNSVSQVCTMAHNGQVDTQPTVGSNFPAIVFSGDRSGRLLAYDPSDAGGGDCDGEASSNAGNRIVGGPIVYPCRSGCGPKTDEVFVLTSNGGSSQLVRFTYSNTTLTLRASLALPWPEAVGLAVEGATLPGRVAITFDGGGVAMVQIDASGNMSLPTSRQLPTSISGAPYWCHAAGCVNLIGVGGQNHDLYVLDTNLATYASYFAGAAITTTPGADAAGDWFFGADDGFLYLVQVQPNPPNPPVVTLAWKYGSMGQIGSSVQVGSCTAGICIYLGSLSNHAYLVPLDARDAVMTACLTTAPPACSSDNPRLWAQVEIGVAGSPQTVHVQGWSYYSP